MCAMGGHGGGAGALVRETTFLEELCEMGHRNDCLVTAYGLRLRSEQILKQVQVKTALVHLRRQVPCLRLCFGESAGTTWLQESTEENIDLEMVEHDAVDEVLALVSRYRFRSRTGPLWCVKVLVGYPPNCPPMYVGETISRPDTGLGTSSPQTEDRDCDLMPRPDIGLGHHPSDYLQCRPLMPGDVIMGIAEHPNRCVIHPADALSPDEGHDDQYDPMMGAVGDIEGALGGNFPPYAPDYGADPSGGYRGFGAGPMDYAELPDLREEAAAAYGSGGIGEVSSGVYQSGEQNVPGMLQGEEIDPLNSGRPVAEGASVSEPHSLPSSNPSSASSAHTSSNRSAHGTLSRAAGVQGGVARQGEEELMCTLAGFATVEETEGAAAATAAATAVASRDIGSSRSSMIDTSDQSSPAFLDTEQSSPAFLDTGSSSLSSSPYRGHSPPSVEAQAVVVGNHDCVVNLVLGIHQGIADGVTAMRICGRLVKLLNDVVGQVQIEDSVPLEENTDSELKEMLDTKIISFSDPEKQEELKAKIENRNNWVSSLEGVFGESGGARAGRGGRSPSHRNRHGVFSLDASMTGCLLQRCQFEGVGLLAAFSAVANIALMDVLTARDVIKDTYSFYSSHGIDLRRYYGGVDAPYLMGCLMAPVHLSTATPRHAADNFWDFARIFESDFKLTEEREEALRELALYELYPPRQSDYDELLNEPLPQMKDFYTSYLEDVTPLVTEGGPHVTVEYVESTMSRHKLGYACCHVLHLFRSSLCVTLNYSSRYLTNELAKEYMSNIYRRLIEVM